MVKKSNLKLKIKSFVNGLFYPLKRRGSKENQVAITLGSSDAHLYWLNAARQPRTTSIKHQSNWSQLFTQVRQFTKAKQVAITLSPAYYQIVTIDKPPAETDETDYHYTILWAVKSLVDLQLDNIQLDYFDAYPSRQDEKIHTIIVNKKLLKSIVQAADEANLNMVKISVEEMTLKHLFESQEAPSMLLLHYHGQALLLAVYFQTKLIYFRRLNGFSQLNQYDAAQIESGVISSLSLEIHRSIDFVESQLKLPPIQRIDLLCEGEKDILSQKLSEQLNQPITLIPNEDVSAIIAEMTFTDLKYGS